MYQNQSGLREPYVYYQDALFIALSTIPSNIVAAVMFKALGAKILLGLALPHTIHYAFKRVIHEACPHKHSANMCISQIFVSWHTGDEHIVPVLHVKE